MKPRRRSVHSLNADVMPSLFVQQAHSDPRNFAVSVFLHLLAALIVALLLHRAVTDRSIIPAGPFTPVQLSDAVLFPMSSGTLR